MGGISKLGIPFKSRTKEYQRAWRAARPEKVAAHTERHKEAKRHSARKLRYRITKEQYEAKVAEQNDSCAICATKTVGRQHTAWHVDHDHDTGKVRGLLCDKCNRGLGYFNDNPDTLLKASKYLENYKH